MGPIRGARGGFGGMPFNYLMFYSKFTAIFD